MAGGSIEREEVKSSKKTQNLVVPLISGYLGIILGFSLSW